MARLVVYVTDFDGLVVSDLSLNFKDQSHWLLMTGSQELYDVQFLV